MSFSTAAEVLDRPLRDQLIADVCRGERLARHSRTLIAVIVLFGGLYGAVLGLWRSPLLGLYVSVKFPLLLFITALLTSLFNWMAASALGLSLRYTQVAVMMLFALAIAAIVLGSVAPIAWFMTMSAPPPTPSARTVHNILYLLHTGLVGSAGFAGTVFLIKILRIVSDRPRARRIYAVWILSFALTSGEVAWLLRPFVGSVYHPVVFIRSDSFQRNVYEFIAADILPHLMSSFREDPCQNTSPCLPR